MHGRYLDQQLTEPVTGLYHRLSQNITVNHYGLQQMCDTASNKSEILKGKSKRKNLPQRLTKLSTLTSQLQNMIETSKANYVTHLTNIFSDNPRKLYSHLNYLSKLNAVLLLRTQFSSHRPMRNC